MMQPSTASPDLPPRVQKLLDLLDRLTKIQEKNISPIVEIEKLRSLPTGTFGKSWANFLILWHLPLTNVQALFSIAKN